jgi:hypothetical protein
MREHVLDLSAHLEHHIRPRWPVASISPPCSRRRHRAPPNGEAATTHGQSSNEDYKTAVAGKGPKKMIVRVTQALSKAHIGVQLRKGH